MVIRAKYPIKSKRETSNNYEIYLDLLLSLEEGSMCRSWSLKYEKTSLKKCY